MLTLPQVSDCISKTDTNKTQCVGVLHPACYILLIPCATFILIVNIFLNLHHTSRSVLQPCSEKALRLIDYFVDSFTNKRHGGTDLYKIMRTGKHR